MNICQALLSGILAVAVPLSHDNRRPGFAQLVSDTSAALGTWKEFPGFVADVELTLDGKVGHGRVIVPADGQVFVESLPDIHQAWATRHLTCLLHGQLNKQHGHGPAWACVGGPREWPGNLYRTDDPFGFGCRMRNRQIVAVEQRSKGRKLTLHLLESCLNSEQEQLPAVIAVHAWNSHTHQLERTATHSQTWRRVGRFDLPESMRVFSAGIHAPECPFVELKLTNHQLFTPAVQVAGDT